jgi:hypothetical protein
MRAAVAAESAGVPTVAIVADGFAQQATLVAGALGLREPALARYPGVIMTDSHSTLRAKTTAHLVPAVVAGLLAGEGTRPAGATTPNSAFDPERTVFAGDLDAVHEHFESQGWTDGLPIMPPTRERVERMLAHCTREPHDEIVVLAPAHLVATPWNVAVKPVANRLSCRC